MTLISKISDKLHGGHHKHSNENTTAAPGRGESSTLGGQNSALDSTAGTAGSSSSIFGHEGTTGESMLRNHNKFGLGTSSTSGTTGSSYGTDSTQYDADGQRKKGLGEKAKEAVGLDKNGRDPKDIGYNQSSSTTSSSTTSGGGILGRKNRTGSNSSSSSSHEDLNRQTTRLGEASMGDSDLHIGHNHHHDKYSKQTAAPIVAERVHDQYEHIDKTRVEELHDRTEVVQTVQPVYDEKTEATQRSVQDHGVEVHEHGQAGLDTRTEAELAAKREQIAREHRSTHDEHTTERSLRPNVDVQSRTTVIQEVSLRYPCVVSLLQICLLGLLIKSSFPQPTLVSQVVPVLERDIYRPHEIEHTKRVVEIHHEAPEIIGSKIAAPISVSEWENKSGSSLRTTGVSSGTATGVTGRRDSSSSSSDEEVEVNGVKSRRKKGFGEKLKEAVGLDPKDNQGDLKDTGFSSGSRKL
jgi:hypothetical protein